MNAQTSNPLLHLEDYPYESIPFSKIKPEHFDEAFPSVMQNTLARIESIEGRTDTPTFANTVEPLSYAHIPLSRLQHLLSNLNSAATNEQIQALSEKWMPELTAFWNGIYQRQALFDRIKRVYDNRQNESLNDEQKMLLETTYRAFVHSGALLDEEGKKQLQDIKRRLSGLSLQFQKNLLHDTHAFRLHLTTSDEVAGLPQSVLAQAAERARKENKEGWIFTLDYPSYGPFMKYASRRDLRERMYRAYMSRAYHGDEFDNSQVVKDEAALRKHLAALLGYPSYAHLVLTERMAGDPQTVMNFLDELYGYARPAAEGEFKELEQLARLDGINKMQAWDVAYYSEKLKQQRLDFDDEKLRPYFPLDATVEGMFRVANKLYGIRFEPAQGIDVYHPDVQVWKVLDRDGSFLALLYTDFYAREGKRQGAWMTSYKDQYRTPDGRNSRPHISIVTNFGRPTGDTPALLNFYEVNTLFHEFGHALHGMLANTTYADLSGTNVYWDFVELPSQIMENWTYEPEVLQMFARHYLTGEPLPAEWIEKIKRSKQFLEGMHTLRQLGFGYLDMAWHYSLQEVPGDLEAFENQVFAPVRFTPPVPGTLMSTQFGHLFAGGYAAGYYSYKWAELLDADAFSIFQKNGIFDAKTARKFRHLLEQGGSRHPMKLYEEFAGRPPKIEALIRRAGFVKDKK